MTGGIAAFFFFSSRRRHTRCSRDWSSDVCSSDLVVVEGGLDPEAHYVLDFSMLKDLMKRLTDEIDHRVLLPLASTKIQVREEGDTVSVAVAGKPRYVFPRIDCALLPVPNTTVEMLAQYLAGRLCKALASSDAVALRAVEVEVEENFGQSATYRESLG